MKKFTPLFILVMILALAFVFSACGKTETSTATEAPATETTGEKEVEPVVITIATGSASGTWYSMMSTLATYWDKLDCVQSISVTSTSGTNESTTFFNNGEANVGTTAGQAAYFSLTGQGPFPKPYDSDYQCILYTSPQVMQYVAAANSDLHYVGDLIGGSLADGAAGSGTSTCNQAFWNCLDDLSNDTVRVEHLGYSEGMAQVQNGQLDAAVTMTSFPNSTVTNVAEQMGVRLLSYTDEQIEAICAKEVYAFPCTVPANTYKGQIEDANTVADSGYVLVSKELSDEVVYEMVKIIYENWDEICEINALFKDWSFTWAFDGDPFIELAPAAAKYLKEVGEM